MKEKEEKAKTPKVGSLGSIVNIAKSVFKKIKNFNIKEDIESHRKEHYMALGITLGIIILMGVIIWLIPATRSFITDMIPF